MNRKKSLKKKRKSNSKKDNGFAKIASITTKSLSSAFVNFKKNQELRKIKEIKLKKLSENNEIIRERKDLKILEEKLKKEIDEGLTIWLEPVGDKSKLRNLRGIVIKGN